ncbi:unnamed protein product [Mesocestoides corti]|uniref:Phosphodiesterase n=2 Tax=Mesocestoides corti TaxID=53468 RepID=A0A158QS97_MESCO|nr:unnamed protein product [Mesocestoides corti]
MGLFVNEQNLPTAVDRNYDGKRVDHLPLEPKEKRDIRPPECSASCVKPVCTGSDCFLLRFKLDEEDPLASCSFETVEPTHLAKGVRLASIIARSELSSVHHLKPSVHLKEESAIAKNINSIRSARSDAYMFDLPNMTRELTEKIVRREFTRKDIFRTAITFITDYAEVDVIYLHIQENECGEVTLLKSDCASQFKYTLPGENSAFCTPSTAAFRSGNMVIANFVMRDARWSKEMLFYGSPFRHSFAYPLFSINGNVIGKFFYLSLTGAVIELLRQNSRPQFDQRSVKTYAKEIVQAERCTLFLVDHQKQELISSILDRGNLHQTKFETVEQIRLPLSVGVAGYVARTGECLVTNDPKSDEKFYQYDGIFNDNFQITNMVTIPIKVGNDPLFSPWRMPDEEMPASFIYMVHDVIGPSKIDLHTLIRFTLTVRKNYRDVIYHNWYHGFSVAHAAYAQIKCEDAKFTEVEKLCILIAALCHDLDHRGRDNSYQRKKGTPLATLYSTSILEHHHFNMTLTILQVFNSYSIPTEFKFLTGYLIAKALGFNSLEIKYSQTLLEHPIMKKSCICGYYYKPRLLQTIYFLFKILMIIKHAILSTDLSRLEGSKKIVRDLLAKSDGVNWQQKEERMATVAVLLPASDLCSMYKPWDVHWKVVLIVMEEMWAQGDEEKKNGSIPIDVMNRDLYHQLPEIQINFFKGICLPLFRLVAQAMPSLRTIPKQAASNFAQWSEMCLLPETAKRDRVKELLRHHPSSSKGMHLK